MPSPVEEQPGLFIRDPLHYSDALLIIPPILVACLDCFDGQQTELDLQQVLVEITGELDVAEVRKNLIDTLSAAGFLEDAAYAQLRADKRSAFAALPLREPAHAGSAYPGEAEPLRATMARYFTPDGDAPLPTGELFAIAAPHVSPAGGWHSYRAAYRALGPALRDRTFVILGTSHYGEPERFGLTRKNYVTPLGEARTDTALVEWLEQRGGEAVSREDFCHSFEHTIEFQVLFLQHVFGPEIRILPVLCGSYAHSLYRGGMPEDNDGVRRFLDALGEVGSREAARLFWVLGIDMAHMGARYGDDFPALAAQGRMQEVEARDRARISRINAGDAAGFWELVRANHDDLKWCGSAPLYTFLKSVPGARGELLRYEQWNIDPQSVVSFAGMGFYR